MRNIILCLFFALSSAQGFSLLQVDDSVDIFFPKSLKYLQYSQTEFPVFWWNFVVIEPLEQAPDFNQAIKICQELQKLSGLELKRIVCNDDISSLMPSLIQWSDDLILREKAPLSQEIKDSMNSSLNEISLLSMNQPDILRLKQADPLDQWQKYLEKTQPGGGTDFTREKGFLVDPLTSRIVIPIQFNQKPQMKNALGTHDILNLNPSAILVGAHSSAYVNEKQVHEDLEVVSVVGIVVLIAFIGFLVFRGRISALLLFPPVALALGLSALVVNQIYGSIHGLTLAFGSGIIGLAVDYGLHGAFNAGSKQTWKSNAIGFLTTLTGLAVMMMSGIPLIRQMMTFAVLGLFFGFIFFYILCRYLPRIFTMKSVKLPNFKFKHGFLIVISLIFLGLGSLLKTNLSFDLRKINFQPVQNRIVSDWFFTRGGPQENFLLLRTKDEFNEQVIGESKWAFENKIQYAGLADFWLAGEEQQLQNIESWQKLCPVLLINTPATQLKIFSPFLENICRTKHQTLNYQRLIKKEYASYLGTDERFISIFTSRSAEQAKLIVQKFPNAQSLMVSVNQFSKSLETDLRWMIPLVFILSSLVLFLYYRSFICVITAYIPFFTGLGLFFLSNLIKGGELDLISVLGLVMVFGFSLDYGVFATDIYKFPQGSEDEDHVYSALGLAAVSNIIGFFPMVFAQHPVLHQLGMALFFGTVGTYLGTIWGIEKVFRWRKPN